jgi:hypothetical protein
MRHNILVLAVIVSTLIGIAATTYRVFQRVILNGDIIEAVFPDEGMRYRITFNGKDEGVSHYGQLLKFRAGDVAVLQDKHSRTTVTPVFSASSNGLTCVSVMADRHNLDITNTNSFFVSAGD